MGESEVEVLKRIVNELEDKIVVYEKEIDILKNMCQLSEKANDNLLERLFRYHKIRTIIDKY